jgi:hypothetical protein
MNEFQRSNFLVTFVCISAAIFHRVWTPDRKYGVGSRAGPAADEKYTELIAEVLVYYAYYLFHSNLSWLVTDCLRAALYGTYSPAYRLYIPLSADAKL